MSQGICANTPWASVGISGAGSLLCGKGAVPLPGPKGQPPQDTDALAARGRLESSSQSH